MESYKVAFQMATSTVVELSVVRSWFPLSVPFCSSHIQEAAVVVIFAPSLFASQPNDCPEIFSRLQTVNTPCRQRQDQNRPDGSQGH
jgi:hypothetical protein